MASTSKPTINNLISWIVRNILKGDLIKIIISLWKRAHVSKVNRKYYTNTYAHQVMATQDIPVVSPLHTRL